MRNRALVVLAAFGSGALVGQQPTLSLLAATPLTTHAQTAAQNTTNTTPSGLLPFSGYCNALAGPLFGPNVFATTYWNAAVTSTDVYLNAAQSVQVTAAGGSGSTGSNDLVMQVASPVARAVTLRIALGTTSTAGLPAAAIGVDIGDDGSFEYSLATHSGTFQQAAAIGPVPLRIRVRMAANVPAGSIGVASSTVSVDCVPDNALQFVPAGIGCIDNGVGIAAIWDDHGAALGPLSPPPPPVAPIVIAVGGLAPQPAFLPPIGGPWPCLLLPRPDFVALQYPFAVGIPLAARPVTVWMQYVVLQPNGVLGTTNGYGVTAN
ncbi:MAG: hypothetical protein QM775_24910 [Pirellulales bacterium]